MGQDLMDLPEVQEKLALAKDCLGWSLFDLTEEEMHRTRFTQPALFLVSALLTDLLLLQGYEPAGVAGHSLGEYSALYAAGAFEFPTGLNLVKQRAALMDHATGGTMTALIGFDRAKLDDLCSRTEKVAIANDNSPEQVVITGKPEAIQTVTDQLKAKRTIPLAVSGAFHSEFMADAATAFSQILDQVELQKPRCPVYSNVTGTASQDPVVIKQRLSEQIVSPVQWRSIVVNMAQEGITAVWEIGPGSVLTGLVKRTAPHLQRLTLNQAAALSQIQG
jgi:[acyl-carrier-protein] S-malonyltransferase